MNIYKVTYRAYNGFVMDGLFRGETEAQAVQACHEWSSTKVYVTKCERVGGPESTMFDGDFFSKMFARYIEHLARYTYYKQYRTIDEYVRNLLTIYSTEYYWNDVFVSSVADHLSTLGYEF